jgi:hypothetical protein
MRRADGEECRLRARDSAYAGIHFWLQLYTNNSASRKLIAGLFLVALLMLFFSPEWLTRWISAF